MKRNFVEMEKRQQDYRMSRIKSAPVSKNEINEEKNGKREENEKRSWERKCRSGKILFEEI